MKRMTLVVLVAMWVMGTVTIAAAQSDSLGEHAREARKDRKARAAKTYDNDNIPRADKPSAPAEGQQASTSSTETGPTANNTPAASEQKTVPEQSRSGDDWKAQLGEQKDKIDLLSRELDVMQREYRLRAAVMYADAGNRLRNQSSWDKEDSDYKGKIAEKQKELDEAKQRLEDTQEQARKAGVPSSARE